MDTFDFQVNVVYWRKVWAIGIVVVSLGIHASYGRKRNGFETKSKLVQAVLLLKGKQKATHRAAVQQTYADGEKSTKWHRGNNG